jgi:phospholipase/lecithinase/hemolysin
MAKRFIAFVFVALLTPALAVAGPITQLVVIGDSLSDQGNGFLLTGGVFPPPPYAQRASNGPVAVERLAERLGVPLSPAAAGGTNYAVVGALTGTDNFAAAAYGQPALNNTGMVLQTLNYLATVPFIDPDALHFVWGGPNDFFVSPSPAAAATALNNLAFSISQLYGAGARRFLVPNMPDLSLTPSGRSLPPLQQAGLQQLVVGFNTGLEGVLAALGALPGIEITPFNTFGLLTDIAGNPGAYGFSNATDACLTGNLGMGGIVCGAPGEYVFWDSVHPTTAAHRVLGDAFAHALPEPVSLSLFGIAAAAGILARRRRTAA